MRVRRLLLGALASIVPFLLLVPACGSTHPTATTKDSSIDVLLTDRSRLDAPIRPDAACEVVIDSPEVLTSPHVDVGTPIDYPTNPPASGPHYPIWAAFQEFLTPVPRPFWVHSLEHGAVVILYNCAALAGDGGAGDDGSDATDSSDASDAGGATCSTWVDGLRAMIAALPEDPLCDKDAGVSRRIVLTPDPLIHGPIAAAAWGWTYNAACFDRPSLEQFVKDHYAKAPENFCANGQTFF